jgi:hypothetical protein
MDWTTQTAPRDSEIINKLLPRITHGFNSANTPSGLRNHQQTAPTGDASIGQPKQLLGTEKSSTKVLPRVRYGFDNANNP